MRTDLKRHLEHRSAIEHYQQDAMFHATIDLFNNMLQIIEWELTDEGIPDDVIRRVVHRLLYTVASPTELAQVALARQEMQQAIVKLEQA